MWTEDGCSGTDPSADERYDYGDDEGDEGKGAEYAKYGRYIGGVLWVVSG